MALESANGQTIHNTKGTGKIALNKAKDA
jgi:hypothetical protein